MGVGLTHTENFLIKKSRIARETGDLEAETGEDPKKPDIGRKTNYKRQIIDHYLKDICNLTQQYGIYTIEFSTPNPNHRRYVIQTDNLDLEFSKVFF